MKGSTPILLCGDQVTGVVNCFGKGKAYLIGTLLGHAYTAFRDSATQAFLLTLLNMTGIKPELCGRLPRRRRVGEGCEAWFLFNMTSETIFEHIDVNGFLNVEDLLEGPLSVRSGAINVKVNPFEIRCLIMRR